MIKVPVTAFPMQVGESRSFCRRFSAYELYYTRSTKDALKAWLKVNALSIFGPPIESHRPDRDTLHMLNEPNAGDPVEAVITLRKRDKIKDDEKGRDYAGVYVRVFSGEKMLLKGLYLLIVAG